MVKQEKIKSLQSLRALAFFSVFSTHYFSGKYYTTLSLSIFFILSGFILSIKYINYADDEKITLKDSFLFAMNRIKKMYLLHIVTMTVDIILYVIMFMHNGIVFKGVLKFELQIIANIFLVQSCIPDYEMNVGLNGVAWFLSVLMILYMAFPLINKKLKNQSFKQYLIIIVSALFLKLSIDNVAILLIGESSYLYEWFVYRNAFIRLFDFIIGYCLGRIYIEKKDIQYKQLNFSFLEIAATILCIYVFKFQDNYHLNIPFIKVRNFCAYVAISSIWVYLFAVKKGFLTKLLSNDFLGWLGDLSGNAFLIHYPVIQWTNLYIWLAQLKLNVIERYILFFIELFVTILLSYFWKILNDRYSKKKTLNNKHNSEDINVQGYGCSKSKTIRICIISLFSIIVLFCVVNFLFPKNTKISEGEQSNYKTIENSITSNVDNAYLVDDGVYMDGWAFITDNDTDNYKIGVIVNNDIYLANKVIRQDVKDYYSLKNAKVGFSIILDNNENFEICIVDQKNKIIYK